MKKIYLSLLLFIAVKFYSQAPSFTINTTSTYSISCSSPTVNLWLSINATGPVQGMWTNGTSTLTGVSVNISTPGMYTVTLTDTGTQLSAAQVITIGQNITVPSANLSPTNQIVSCGNGPASFTAVATAPSNNIYHEWHSPLSPSTISQLDFTQMSLYSANAPGTYTVKTCNAVNGCCTSNTVAVTSINGFPAFNTSSTTNYSLGCNSNSSTLCIINVTTLTNGPANFLFLPPGTPSSVPIPQNAFSVNSCTVVTTPGNWTVVVNDIANQCQTILPLTITQNTIAPSGSGYPLSNTLTCSNPSFIASCSLPLGYTSLWKIPTNPPTNINGPTFVVSLGQFPPAPGYTLVVTDPANGCSTNYTMGVSQNTTPPVPMIAIGNPSMITCTNSIVVMSYSGSTGGSGVPGAVSLVQSWMGPAPQASVSGVNTYTAYTPGVYTLTTMDSYNGCAGTKTVYVASNYSGCVGIDELSKINLKIYPNPSNGKLYIDNPDQLKFLFELKDNNGKLLRKEDYQELKNVLDLKLPPGIYFYKIVSESGAQSNNKLIIE